MCCFYLEPFVTGSEPVELMLQIYNYICLEAAKARAGIVGRNGPKGYIRLQYISTYSLLVCISLPGDAPGAEPEEQRGGLPGGQSLMLITNFFKIAMRTLAILALHHQHLKVLTFRSLVSSVVVGAGLRPISWHVHGIADSSADSLCGEQVASQSEETSVPVIVWSLSMPHSTGATDLVDDAAGAKRPPKLYFVRTRSNPGPLWFEASPL